MSLSAVQSVPWQCWVILHDEVEEGGHLLDEDGVKGQEELNDVRQVSGVAQNAFDAR